jgi:hypothetical protein
MLFVFSQILPADGSGEKTCMSLTQAIAQKHEAAYVRSLVGDDRAERAGAHQGYIAAPTRWRARADVG